MGCFNVSCGISSVSMYCDDAVLIPLIPNGYDHEKRKGINLSGAMIVSNEGCKCFFSPMTLPIFGSLDSYGCLENIVEDANTKAIEKYYKMPIHDFCEKIVRNDLDKEFPDKSVAGMFVHRKIFDTMSTTKIGEFGEDERVIYLNGDISPYVLNMLGFVEQEDPKNPPERYDRLFTNKLFPTVKIWSDGTWVRVDVGNKKDLECSYCVKDLVKLIEKMSKKKFPAKIINTMKKTETYAVEYEISKKRFEERLSIKEKKLEGNEARFALMELKMDYYKSLSLGSYYDYNGSVDLFENIYKDNVKDNSIKDLYVKMKNFDYAMFSVNRLYMPTFNGFQHGNHYMSEVLYKKSLEVVNQKNKEK